MLVELLLVMYNALGSLNIRLAKRHLFALTLSALQPFVRQCIISIPEFKNNGCLKKSVDVQYFDTQ